MRQIVALAPTLLALSRAGLSKERAQALISYVIDIHPIIIRNIWLRPLVAPEAIAALYDNQRYPIRNVFHAIAEMAELSRQYSGDDLARMFRSIVDRSVAPQTSFGIEDILLDTNFSVHPNPISSADLQCLHDCEMEFFAYCSLAIKQHIATRGQLAPYSSLDVDCVEVHGTVVTASPEGLIPDQLRIDATLPVVRLGKTMFDFLDPFGIWVAAESAEELHLAILVGAYQMVQRSDTMAAWKEVAGFRIGSEFFESLAVHAAVGDKEFSAQVFESCFRIVADAPKHPLREFRQTKNVASPVRVRTFDNAIALRTHVTGANEGIRLMCWRLSCGTIEFANVGTKDELVIRQGNAVPAFQYTA